MWVRTVRDFVRYVLSPMVGLLLVVHEFVITAEPRILAVATGLSLAVGVPIDAALRALSAGLAPSSPVIPPSPPSLPPASDGG